MGLDGVGGASLDGTMAFLVSGTGPSPPSS